MLKYRISAFLYSFEIFDLYLVSENNYIFYDILYSKIILEYSSCLLSNSYISIFSLPSKI